MVATQNPRVTSPHFSATDARRFYDAFGAKQDRQGFYEDAALDRLIASGDFTRASRVFEFGCGTGRLARRLLRAELGDTACYRGVDVSETMVGLAGARLAAFGDRAAVERINGDESELPVPSGWAERFLSTYVFDLLSEQDIVRMLAEARRILAADGLLCHAGITPGRGWGAAISRGWSALHKLRPALVGGCRPIVLGDCLDVDSWRILTSERIRRWGITSEVLIARRL